MNRTSRKLKENEPADFEEPVPEIEDSADLELPDDDDAMPDDRRRDPLRKL